MIPSSFFPFFIHYNVVRCVRKEWDGALRLWKSGDETSADPLFEALHDDTHLASSRQLAAMVNRMKHRLPYKYEIAEAIDPAHPETPEKDRLCDGFASDPVTQSLQVNGSATIRVDLEKPQKIASVMLSTFYRRDDFVLEKAIISASNDAAAWTKLGELAREKQGDRRNDSAEVFRFTAEKPVTSRYLKIETVNAGEAKRVLLGELVILPPEPARAEPEEPAADAVLRPMHVKQTLDKALLEAGVRFLYSTYCTGVLADAAGNQCGVTINNRAGRQAIVAKTVIRCDEAEVAGDGPYLAEFVVIGGKLKTDVDLGAYPLLGAVAGETVAQPFLAEVNKGVGAFPIHCYRFEIAAETAHGYAAGNLPLRNALETQIRLATYDPEQQFTADAVSVFPKNAPESARPSVAARIHKGRERGRQAAAEALKKNRTDYANLRPAPLSPVKCGTILPGEVCQLHENTKAFRKPLGFVQDTQSVFPVVGEYDVVVVGGGVAGAPAGIAAARQGAKTLVLEYLHDLGGMGTAGAISVYWFGNRVGFCQEIEGGKSSWNIEQRGYWWRSKLAEAGADAWYGVLGSGTVVEMKDGTATVKGVLIATQNGLAVVRAKVVIDATGNGGIAESAGARIHYVDGKEIAMQGHGLPPRRLGASYTNTDYMYVDETDVEDVTHLFVYGKEKFPGAFDFGKIPDTRERRQVDGELTFTTLDQVNGRTYPDTLLVACSNYDTHGYTVEPYMELEQLPASVKVWGDVPLRSSLPKGLDGILVGGLAMSCHRDAIPIIRMQPDLQNHGYALGCVAALAAKEGVPLRKLDIKPVQEHLVEIGNLPPRVLTDTDNYDQKRALLPEAIKTVVDENYRGSALLLWYPEQSIPLLREAYAGAESADAKLVYAMVLAAMHDATGADAILDAIKTYGEWDKGWNFRGMGQFGWSASPLDRMIMMLGRTRDPRGAAVVIALLEKLEAKDDFSHHRACALALEWIGDRAAAKAIHAHLQKPGVAGYVHHDLETAKKWDRDDPHGGTAERSRRNSLIEIGFARALYRLGDVDGMGQRILEDYTKDLRGIFSRHAGEVLREGNRE